MCPNLQLHEPVHQLGAILFSPVRSLLDAKANISVRSVRPGYEPIRGYVAMVFSNPATLISPAGGLSPRGNWPRLSLNN